MEVPAGGACSYDGVVEAVDDRDGDSHCWNVTKVGSEFVGERVPFFEEGMSPGRDLLGVCVPPETYELGGCEPFVGESIVRPCPECTL